MAQVKYLEVRDSATFIPVLAVLLQPNNDGAKYSKEDHYLLHRCGYDLGKQNIMLTKLSGEGKATADPWFWGDRTMHNAHMYIYLNWMEITTGDVVDVEYILKETTEPKQSERITT